MDRDDRLFSETLGCFWNSVECGAPGVVVINVPKHSCTDMTGAIEVAQLLMHDVKQVTVFSDGKPDIVYLRRNDEEWEAKDLRVL